MSSWSEGVVEQFVVSLSSTLQHRVKVALLSAVLIVLLLLYFIDGPLQPVSIQL